jgi:serine/threonine-protein kinase
MRKRFVWILSGVLVGGCGGGDIGGGDGAGDDDGSTGADAGTGPGGPDAGAPPTGPYFPNGAVWYTDVTSAPVDAESDMVIGYLDALGWATDGIFQIDFSIEVLDAAGDTPMLAFEPTGDFFEPDCDHVAVPVPVGGAIEGEPGYECLGDGDCHLIVVHRPTQQLFEMWRANISGGTFYGGCLVVWDMQKVYPENGRGEGCTSADAAGFPIAPLLFTADEVASGEIAHAIRFIVPNANIRDNIYVRPATHSTGPTSGPAAAPPYGARLRLRPDFDESRLPNEGARVVARALKTYGMFLADAGNVPLTAQSDRFTTSKWDGLLGPHDLDGIVPGDFEMIEAGQRFDWSGDCVRNP